MHFRATPFSVTTILLVLFACVVIYVRLKGWLDSNVPILFYLAMIVYTNALEGQMPPWVYLGFGFTLLLRFEFMNTGLSTVLKACEFGVLGKLMYSCLELIVY
ncbi:MAG: hypothetical protein M3Z32_00975 [Acidobacteriota bacterium]|nr:hypothetical protein [Acidobacteriota bacterium]